MTAILFHSCGQFFINSAKLIYWKHWFYFPTDWNLNEFQIVRTVIFTKITKRDLANH
jgi:hypothetical protein